jgi:hypothetical protein
MWPARAAEADALAERASGAGNSAGNGVEAGVGTHVRELDA